ncbi:MAG: hypothetical protein ACKOWF_12735 [Chloroflexota bacterium]
MTNLTTRISPGGAIRSLGMAAAGFVLALAGGLAATPASPLPDGVPAALVANPALAVPAREAVPAAEFNTDLDPRSRFGLPR